MRRNVIKTWTDLDRLQREMNALFSPWGFGGTVEYPPLNVWTNQEGAVVTAELPGLDRNRLEINILGDTLTLKGVREEPKLESGQTWHRRERGFGEFNRTLQLDFRIQSDKVVANYNRGVLEILIPRALGDQSRTIKVTAG